MGRVGNFGGVEESLLVRSRPTRYRGELAGQTQGSFREGFRRSCIGSSLLLTTSSKRTGLACLCLLG